MELENKNMTDPAQLREAPADRLNVALDAVVASDWNAPVTVKSADLRAILAALLRSSAAEGGGT